MPYVPTAWVEAATDLSAANLNKIENGIAAADPGYAIIRQVGPWNANGAVPPNAFSGTAFTVQSTGTYLISVSVSCWVTAVAAANFYIYIDGNYIGTVNYFFNRINFHMASPVHNYLRSLAAGTHYFWINQQSGMSSDNGDQLDVAFEKVGP